MLGTKAYFPRGPHVPFYLWSLMVASQMMAAPQMGLAPRRGQSHERSFLAAPATSSSKSHTKIWVFHCQLLLLTSTVWSRIAACETTMKTVALKHLGKRGFFGDCGCSGVLVACCPLVLCCGFFRGEWDVWELFSTEVTSRLFRITHSKNQACDGTISKPKSIHSYSFTPRSVPAVPKRL